MTEDEAKWWLHERFGDTAVGRLQDYAAMLLDETTRQNLIAPSTIDQLWIRHFVDSAQLVQHGDPSGKWVDVGSGAGLPGIVLAVLGVSHVTLIEPRRLRAEFLDKCVRALGLANAVVRHRKAENATGTFDVVTARAVASLSNFFDLASRLYDQRTAFVLPKGRSADNEVAIARQAWHGVFHVKHSVVDPSAGIVVASGVSRR